MVLVVNYYYYIRRKNIMKETFRLYLKNEIEKYNNVLAKNELSEEDKNSIEATIENLNNIMDALDQVNDNAAIEELKNSLEELNQSIVAIKEKMNQTKDNVEENKPEIMNENYLQSKNSVSDFLNVIRTSRNGMDFSKNWRNKLAENSISFEEGAEYAYLPQDVRSRIMDLWEKKADWLTSLKTINAKAYTCRYNQGDQDALESRAKGWRKGNKKKEQVITLTAKKVIPQFIYKIQVVDAETRFNDDGTLLNYLLEELVGQILYEEKRAILIGDGRDANSEDKISSIEPIYKGQGATTDNFTTIVNRTATSFMLDDLHELVSKIKREGDEDIVVFIATSAINEATRVAASDTSTPLYLEDEQLAAQIRARRIIVTDILDLAGVTAIAMVLNKYVLVGENVLNPQLFTQHDIWYNQDIFRFECPVAGAIEGLKSTAVLLPYNE